MKRIFEDHFLCQRLKHNFLFGLFVLIPCEIACGVFIVFHEIYLKLTKLKNPAKFAEILCKLFQIEWRGQHRKTRQQIGQLFKEQVEQKGFNLHEYEVCTEDNYYLTVHRITKADHRPKRVAFVQHGLKASSADWHVGGLAYSLIEHGEYDVWMGNFRGSKFSRKHAKWNEKDKEFWDFSWDELGMQDLPTMLDLVLSKTGHAKVDFFGHSMATTAFFVMLNEFPHRNSQIERCVALAPVSRLANIIGYPTYFIPTTEMVANYSKYIGIHSIDFSKHIPGYSLFALLVTFVMGYHDTDLDQVQDLLTFSPDACSMATLSHYISCHKAGKFQSRNGQKEYSLKKVKVPVEIYFSSTDWASCTEDNLEIASQLPNLVSLQKIGRSDFGHLDFMWSTLAIEKLYPTIVKKSEGEKVLIPVLSDPAVIQSEVPQKTTKKLFTSSINRLSVVTLS